jgi:hypothetical protein
VYWQNSYALYFHLEDGSIPLKLKYPCTRLYSVTTQKKHLSYSILFLLSWRWRQVIILFAIEGTVLYFDFWHCLKFKLKHLWEVLSFSQEYCPRWCVTVCCWVSVSFGQSQPHREGWAVQAELHGPEDEDESEEQLFYEHRAQLAQRRVTSQNNWVF